MLFYASNPKTRSHVEYKNNVTISNFFRLWTCTHQVYLRSLAIWSMLIEGDDIENTQRYF